MHCLCLLLLLLPAAAYGGHVSYHLPKGAVRLNEGVYTAPDPRGVRNAHGVPRAALVHVAVPGVRNKSRSGGGEMEQFRQFLGQHTPYAYTPLGCGEPLADGARWKNTVPQKILLDDDNVLGATRAQLRTVVEEAVAVWEDVLQHTFFGGFEVAEQSLDGADFDAPDGSNEITWGVLDIPDAPGALAVTIVWGFFQGPVETREIVEADMVFDDRDWVWTVPWSSAADPQTYDMGGVAVHEMGHFRVGLADLYASECQTSTMYGLVSTSTDTEARTLHETDRCAAQKLYGEQCSDIDFPDDDSLQDATPVPSSSRAERHFPTLATTVAALALIWRFHALTA